MKKKVISALLASTMIVSLVACGSTGGDSSDTNSKSSGTTASSTAGGDEAKDTSSDSGSGDAAGSGDWVAAADEADDAVPGENDDRAFAKFDHVVEVHYGYQIDPKDTTLPDGDSVDNNQYTRYLLDNYNIKVVCDWTAGNASDFQQKVSLAIASASLPDAVVAPTRNYLVQAARADLLADLWPEFNQYASKQVKEIIETTEGRAINNATVDGTFCALPNISVDTDGVYLYFIRQDWLDQLGLEVPKTVDELGEVAQKFKDAGLSPDYAIAGIDNGGRTYSNFLNSSNNGYGFDAVYQAFNATPGYFLKDDSGELYWGTTTDEMKEALTTLHDISRNTELCDDRIGFGFKFMHHHRVVDGCADDHRLVAHRAAAFENIVEISLVVGSVCLSKIAAVREILAEITAGNAHLTRFFRRIRAVLQCNRQIAVAAVRKIFGGIRVACRAFDKYQRHIGLLR